MALKTPGTDRITVDLLQNIDINMDKLTALVNQDLDDRVAIIKEVEVLFIPKYSRDPSIVKGWRPISLLLVVAKGVERAMAEWIEEKGLK